MGSEDASMLCCLQACEGFSGSIDVSYWYCSVKITNLDEGCLPASDRKLLKVRALQVYLGEELKSIADHLGLLQCVLTR